MDVQPREQKDLHQQDEDWKHDLKVQMQTPQSEPEICQPTKCMRQEDLSITRKMEFMP
jgi:hypothetical protein